MEIVEREGLHIDEIVSRSRDPKGIVKMSINEVGFEWDYEQAGAEAWNAIGASLSPYILIHNRVRGGTYVSSDYGARFCIIIPDRLAATKLESLREALQSQLNRIKATLLRLFGASYKYVVPYGQ